MNITRKNTLFVVSLLLAVFVSVSVASYFLVRHHVAQEVERELARAHHVFVEAQQYAFERLLNVAEGLGREPSLRAAVLTGSRATIRGTLDELFPMPGMDLLALYFDTGPANAIASGRKPHFTSPQMLASAPFRALVRSVADGAPVAYGNALVFDSFLRLTAIPLESPLGGAIGVMLVGEEVAGRSVEDLSQLVRADVTLISGNTILGTTLPPLDRPLAELGYDPHRPVPLQFLAGGEAQIGRLYPILAADGTTVVGRVLLSRSLASYWAPYKVLASTALAVYLVILAVAAFAGVGISRATLTRPIRRLVEGTRRIAGGDLAYRVPSPSSSDELGELARSFNAMLSEISSSRSEIEASRRRFHDFAESSSDWLWETDAAGRFSYVSSSVRTSLGLTPEQLLGRRLDQLFPRDDLGQLTALLAAGERPAAFQDLECKVTLADGGSRHLRLNGLPVTERGSFLGFRGTARDITKARQDEARMQVLANQDQLTGLSNRSRFMRDLAEEIRDASARGREGILMLIDLDHLKLINDTAGHAVGDQLIVQVAGAMRQMVRRSDLMARLSGDEFAVALPNLDRDRGMAFAREVLDRVQAIRLERDGHSIHISASIGLVAFPGQGRDPVELLAKADTAMYAAKDGGRGRAAFFDEADMARERMGSLLAWKGRITQALEQDGLVLAFQPISSVVDRQVHHYEVLVRMRDPDSRELIMPGSFIPAAEQFGMIQQLDRWVVTHAIRYLGRLPAAQRHVQLAINLSGLSVADSVVLELIEREVRAAGIEPGRLTFEVTESAACEQLSRAAQFLWRIRKLGCHIALDDFGVGFSSFSYLKHLKVDSLKIDGGFVRDAPANREDQLFIKALVDVARGMGIRTVAEYVENQEVFELVRGLGVDYAQGYYIGRPVLDVSKAARGGAPSGEAAAAAVEAAAS